MGIPTQDISWATDDDYPAGPNAWNGQPNKVEPSSGRKAEGWEPNQKPPAEEMDWWMNGVAAWIGFLVNAPLAWSSVTITDAEQDDLDLTGGTGSLDNRPLIMIDGGGSSASITGITHGTPGRVLVLQNTTGVDLMLAPFSGSSSAGNKITVNDVPADGDSIRIPQLGFVALWHNGIDWYLIWSSFPIETREVLVIPAAKARSAGADAFFGNNWDLADGAGGIYFPIELPVGCILQTFKFTAQKSSDGTKTITATITEIDESNFGTTNLDTKTNNANNPGQIFLTEATPMGYEFAIGKSVVGFIKSDKGSGGFDFAGALEISYTRRRMAAPFAYAP